MKKTKFRTKFYLIIFIFIYLLLNFHKTNLVFAMHNNNLNYIVEKDFLNESYFNNEASSSSVNQNNNNQEIDLNLSLKLPEPENYLFSNEKIILQFKGFDSRSEEEIKQQKERRRIRKNECQKQSRKRNPEANRRSSLKYYNKKKEKIKLKSIEKVNKIINNNE